MLRHPEVQKIVQLRQQYQQAREDFLVSILSNPLVYTLSQDGLDAWLMLTIDDAELSQEIRTAVAAGFPIIHWGGDIAACGVEGLPRWQFHAHYTADITCPACQQARKDGIFAWNKA